MISLPVPHRTGANIMAHFNREITQQSLKFRQSRRENALHQVDRARAPAAIP